MTPAPGPPPAPAATWPAVYDTTGALVVNCALDPHELLAKIDSHLHAATLGVIAVKTNGGDIAADTETRHCMDVWRQAGLVVGVWVWCAGPPEADVEACFRFGAPAFAIFDVESPYKVDEGGHYEWAAQLVAAARARGLGDRAAVTSYGGYKASIDFASFARAGWPVFAQLYDSFAIGDELSYGTARGGPYPIAGIRRLLRSLDVDAGEWIYRPEGIDG